MLDRTNALNEQIRRGPTRNPFAGVTDEAPDAPASSATFAVFKRQIVSLRKSVILKRQERRRIVRHPLTASAVGVRFRPDRLKPEPPEWARFPAGLGGVT